MTDTDDLSDYLAEKLRGDGFSGLYDDDCCCELGDLIPCIEASARCRPGYKHECDECPRTEDDCPVGDWCTPGGFCVGPDKDFPEARDE